LAVIAKQMQHPASAKLVALLCAVEKPNQGFDRYSVLRSKAKSAFAILATYIRMVLLIYQCKTKPFLA
jgi:hypothetical protein